MKKLIAVLIVAALVISTVCVLVACDGNKSEVAKAVAAAQKMSLQELEEASKKEFTDNPNAKFEAHSLTSGVNKALTKFIEKYDWLTADNAKYVSEKGSVFQEALNTAADTGNGEKVGDFVMIQDAAFVHTLYNAKFLHSYVPSGDGFNIAKDDQNPLVGVTFNKIFYYNSALGNDYIKNVWQLTGKDGSTLKAVPVSYQSPLGEDINMSFLIMLTAPAYEAQLKTAYKSYFGKDYAKESGCPDDCKKIGYHFVEQFIAAVKTWHDSDTSEVKAMNDAAHKAGGTYFAGLAKVKDYNGANEGSTDPNSPSYWKSVLKASGYNYEIEGFNGFVYNMWTLIPDTADNPYTACLFIRYLLSEEGFKAGFNEVGYYSANTLVGSADGTTLDSWKKGCLGEDPDYLSKNYESVSAFIKQQMTLAGKGE